MGINPHNAQAGQPILSVYLIVTDHSEDEFFVAYDAATRRMEVDNTGQNDLVMLKFFGEGVNSDAPGLYACL